MGCLDILVFNVILRSLGCMCFEMPVGGKRLTVERTNLGYSGISYSSTFDCLVLRVNSESFGVYKGSLADRTAQWDDTRLMTQVGHVWGTFALVVVNICWGHSVYLFQDLYFGIVIS